MPKITYIAFDGIETEIEAETGISVMQAAVKNSVPGIVAECGGACVCATCHVKVAQEWVDKLPEKKKNEEEMLIFALDPSDNSRLSCQIQITDDLDGLVVNTPKSQI